MASSTAPISDDDKAAILDLHAQGMSRNDIARQTGRGAATVTRVVHAAGLSFDRSATIHATRARQADLAEKRAQLELRYLERAAELLEQMDKPHIVYNIGGKDNIYTEHELDKPTTGDIRNLMQSASIATTASLKIATSGVGETDNSAVDTWLEHMLGVD